MPQLEYRNLLRISGSLSSGATILSGTLTGTKQTQKIVEINGYDVRVPVAEHLIVMIYTDRPGIVASYGKEFGEGSINIAGMQIARQSKVGRRSARADRRLTRARRTARLGGHGHQGQLLRKIDIVDA